MTPSPAPKPTLVLLVGHCGPDTSYLRIAVQKALPSSTVRTAHDLAELDRHLAELSPDAPRPLLLVNRALEPGFNADSGVDLIAHLRNHHPAARLLLVSNYPDAQAAAERAGALPGFGKRDIGSPRLAEVLQSAAKA